MPELQQMLRRAKKALGIVTARSTSPSIPGEPPKDTDSTDVINFIDRLVSDSRAWKKISLQRRFRDYVDPVDFWADARKLESGDHWEVWGSRRKKPEDKWKAELVEDEIQNQIRAKVAYITANYHDIRIYPNVNNIDKLVYQERKKTDWGGTIRQGLKQAKIEGTAIFQTILDTDETPEGVVREVLLENESILPTPFAKSLALKDGSWYLGLSNEETVQQVLRDWDVKLEDLEFIDHKEASDTKPKSIQPEKKTEETKFVESLVFYLDDPSIEKAPYEQEETDEEHIRLDQGLPVSVNDGENHLEHIEAHLDWLEEIWSVEDDAERDEEEFQRLEVITELVTMHIEEHSQAVEHSDLAGDERYKYPFGRLIIIKGGIVVTDEPNPFLIPWRKLFNVYVNEKVPHHFWGRGDVEILWNRNFVMDDMLSKFADSAWNNSYAKEYWHIDDKETLQQEDYSDDSMRPQFYDVAPPERRPTNTVPGFLDVFGLMRDSANRASGISEVTYGRAPHARASGEMTELLIQQSAILVTGEANVNLNETVEKLIETRLLLYREFYTQPRFYYLEGRMVMVTVADLLSRQPVFDLEGEVIGDEFVPNFEVTVEPKSNFPTRFDALLQLVMQLAQIQHPGDGMTFLPREAVLDVLADQHPELGVGGKYYEISQALAAGIEVLQKQQEEEERDEAVASQVENRQIQKGIEELMGGS